MVSREQIPVPVQKHDVPARMARCGNREQIFIELNRVFSVEKHLRFNAIGVCAMNDAPATEVLMELLVIGDIVLMREEQRGNAAQRFNPPDKLF